MIKGNL